MDNKISIIIPSYNQIDSLSEIIDVLKFSNKLIDEIIIVDSSNNDNIKNLINNKKNNLLSYYRIDKAYPGKARNFGVNKAKNKWIAFIDTKTIPTIDWVVDSIKKIKLGYDIIFGSVKYNYNNNFEKIVRDASYGNIGHICVPGTFIKKKIFIDNNFFKENILAGEDVLWKNILINKKYRIFYPKTSNANYNNLPNNLFFLLKKYFIYSYHASSLEIFNAIKNAYFYLFFSMVILLIPNLYFLSLNTKIILLKSIISLIFISIIINILEKLLQRFFYFKIFCFFIYLIIYYKFINIFIIDLSIFFLNKNYFIIYYIILILLTSIFLRGVYLPYKRKIKDKIFFDIYKLKIGMLGMLLDLTKGPFYIIGSFFILFNFFLLKKINQSASSTERKKILFLCPYPYDQQAGQRLKYEQHLGLFLNNGFIYDIKPFININFWNIVYLKKFYFRKIIYTIVSYLRRTFLIFNLHKYDVIYVFLWVTPFGSFFYEFLYRFFSKKIIYDIEDNIFINTKNEINLFINYIKFKNKYIYLIKNSDFIITSSPNLKKICDNYTNHSKKNTSLFIPPSINLNKYFPIKKVVQNKVIKIGWTGTFSSHYYLATLSKILQKLSNIIKIQIIIISNDKFLIDNVDSKFIKWTKTNEISDLLEIDIGLYPLINEPWVEGKSGLKAMQYMALGIPTIATNIGQVKNIIDHRINGYLVNDESEWLDTLIFLCKDVELRKKISIEGRKKIENMFSFNKIGSQYLQILNNL